MIGSASDRLIVPLVERAGALRVGPGDQAGVDVGPLIREDHRNRVAGFVARGEAEGAEVLLDGRDQIGQPGYFLGPTILDRVSDEMAVGRDEIFGPVLSLSRASTLEEAIEQANRSALGNMASSSPPPGTRPASSASTSRRAWSASMSPSRSPLLSSHSLAGKGLSMLTSTFTGPTVWISSPAR